MTPARRRSLKGTGDALDFFSQPGVELFTDQNERPHVRFPVGNHFETHPLRGKRFKNAVVRWYAASHIPFGRAAFKALLDTAEAFAEERRVELNNRSGWEPGTDRLWLDLGDEGWRAIRIDANGWETHAHPPTMFRRFAHQSPLPEPDPAGHVRELLEYLPQLANSGDQLLVLAFITLAPIPMPRPILALFGTQGAAKSTASAFLRRLIDPSRVELLGGDKRADLPLTFYQHALPVFDNLDGLQPAEADLFCQATTGRGIARRQLYTDDGEIILSFRRPIIVNGLRLPTNRADFLDRVLPVELERITPERRVSARQIEARFEAARPRIIGGILNALSGAMQLLPSMPEDGLGRMADFHLWGRAVATCLGEGPVAFDAAYAAAEARQKSGAAENTLAQALLFFGKAARRWEGTPAELYDRLIETAQERHLKRDSGVWPDGPAGLGKRLKHLGEALGDHGLTIARLARKTSRVVRVEYDPEADRLGREE